MTTMFDTDNQQRPALEGVALSPPTSPDRPRGSFSILQRVGAWRDALRRRMLAAADVLAISAAGIVGALLGDGVGAVWVALAIPVWLVLAKLYGLYDNDHRALRHLTVDELPSLIAWATTGTATYFALISIVGQQSVGAPAAVRFWLMLLVLTPVMRAAARAIWRGAVPKERALLVGSGPLEMATLRKLELFEDIHVECVGVVDDSPWHGSDVDSSPTEALEDQLTRHETLDRIIIASPNVSELLIAHHVGLCRRHGLKLSIVPPARGMFGTAVQLHHIADLPMIEYSTWDTARSTMLLKRAVDVVISGTALLLLAPLLVVTAALVRATSRGPAFFVQGRAGINGESFRMFKFRTMVADAEHRLSDVVDVDQLADPMFKLRSDPRVTPLGRLLRRMSVDELPQLINVFVGSMSLVGPRPEQLDLVARYAPEHRFRLNVKPGITGPMQVYGRGELRFDERLAVEREYVENLSLRRDVRLVLLTIGTVLRGRGAF